MSEPVPRREASRLSTPSTDAERRDTETGGDRTGFRGEVTDRFDRWVLPVIRWVRRTLWVPIASGLLALVLGVAAALVWLGVDGDGLVLAGLVALLLAAAPLGVGLFVRVLGDLAHLPETVMAAPAKLGDLRKELAAAGGEVRDLRRSGLLGLPGAFGWLRRTIARLDAVGVAGLTAAVAALHPLRLAWILFLAWLSIIALPLAALALLTALAA